MYNFAKIICNEMDKNSDPVYGRNVVEFVAVA
ncbi:MAG: hypothetical protein QG611_1308, partial [Bacteroidota bacterium]|nr:hypothetical protein [Bacteroidota bacterium]